MNYVRIIFQKLLFPLPKILWQLIIVLIGHHVLLHPLKTLYFLQYRTGIGINYVNNHSCFSTILTQSFKILIKFSHKIVLCIFQLKPHERDQRAVSRLYIFLDSQNSLIQVKPSLQNFAGAYVMLDMELDGCIFYKIVHASYKQLFKFFQLQILKNQNQLYLAEFIQSLRIFGFTYWYVFYSIIYKVHSTMFVLIQYKCNQHLLIQFNYLSIRIIMNESKLRQMVLIDSELMVYQMEMIGKGEFGEVFRGYDELNSRFVALKQVYNDSAQTWRYEVEALKSFDHPNILKYYGCIPCLQRVDAETKKIIIITELIEGKTLQSYIERNKKFGQKGLSQGIVWRLFNQLVDGINHMNERQYVHRDIKPQNILVNIDENIKIIDLGQSKQRMLQNTNKLGTPLYSSPESIQKGNLKDFRRDVWSLGLVLYQMINGECLFKEEKKQNNQKKFLSLLYDKKEFEIKYPEGFCPFWSLLTRRMLQKNYENRYHIKDVLIVLKKHERQIKEKLNIQANQQQNLMSESEILSQTLTEESRLIGNKNPLAEYDSQIQYNRTKKYFKFTRQKYKFLLQLPELFLNHPYPFLSNSHKLMLIFIVYNLYLASIKKLLENVTDERVLINENQVYKVSYLEGYYKNMMMKIVMDFRRLLQSQERATRNIIWVKIIPQFSAMKVIRTEQKEMSVKSNKVVSPSEMIDEYPEVKALVENFKIGISFSREHYIEKFKQLIFSKEFYHPIENIKRYFYQEDILIYYLMLIISNFDEFFDWTNCYYGNQMNGLLQEMKKVNKTNQKREAFIKNIQMYNIKQF